MLLATLIGGNASAGHPAHDPDFAKRLWSCMFATPRLAKSAFRSMLAETTHAPGAGWAELVKPIASALFVAVSLLIATSASASMALADLVEFEGETLRVHYRADQLSLPLPRSPALNQVRKELPVGCSAGDYLVGRWRIQNGRLLLLAVFGCGEHEYPVSSLYPKRSSPLLADWVDEDLELPMGELLCHVPYAFELRRTLLKLKIRSGKVEHVERFDMREDPRVPPKSNSDRHCLGALK